jgi:biopolymer transport protein ExbB
MVKGLHRMPAGQAVDYGEIPVKVKTQTNTNNLINNFILMKKIFATLTVLAMLTFGSAVMMAQDEAAAVEEAAVEQVDEAAPAAEEVAEAPAEEAGGMVALHKTLKTKFIEGGAGFMALTLVTLVFGLALCIERIIYLSLSKTNTKELLANIEAALKEGGIEKALEVCRNTRGPVASIFYQGLSRYDEGIDVVEKTVASYGGVQLGLLEKNLSWITLFIAIAPSLGFLGTIIGMIEAFDKIQQVGDISATVVAGGIKVALLTTLLGLIIAVVLQLFYNYILSLVEGLVNEMEDSSISLLDIVVEYDKAQKK